MRQPIQWRKRVAARIKELQPTHRAAPASGGRYGIATKFTRAVRDLAGRFEHRLETTRILQQEQTRRQRKL
jgi:hypothetical protein